MWPFSKRSDVNSPHSRAEPPHCSPFEGPVSHVARGAALALRQISPLLKESRDEHILTFLESLPKSCRIHHSYSCCISFSEQFSNSWCTWPRIFPLYGSYSTPCLCQCPTGVEELEQSCAEPHCQITAVTDGDPRRCLCLWSCLLSYRAMRLPGTRCLCENCEREDQGAVRIWGE